MNCVCFNFSKNINIFILIICIMYYGIRRCIYTHLPDDGDMLFIFSVFSFLSKK